MTSVAAAKGTILGLEARRRCAMLIFRNTLLLLALILGSMAAARDAAAAPQTEMANQPDAADVVGAFSTLRHWLDEFTVPAADSPQARVKMANSSGLCIVLRRSGRVLGVGIDVVADELMLRRAAAQALSQVLSDPALHAMFARLESEKKNEDRARDIEQLQRDIGRSISIELEVAGKLSPLIGQSLEQMARKLDPGIDGVAMRVNQSWHFSFPAQLRTSNANPEPARVLESLVLTSSFPLKDVRTISQRSDVGMYSFRSITLSQPAPDRPPHQLFRGDLIVSPSSVTRESVLKLSDGIAQHLVNSMWPEPAKDETGTRLHQPQPVGLRGDYQLVSDQYQPLFAPPFDQAIAALALHRYAKVSDADDATAALAMHTSLRILRELAQVTDRELDPMSEPLTCAAIVYAVSEMPALRTDALIGPMYQSAARVVVDWFSDEGTFVARQSKSKAAAVPPMSQAMLAGALTRLLTLREESLARLEDELVRKALDAAWASAPKPHLVDLLPWIGWAESEYARHTKSALAHADELRSLVEMLEQSRIGPSRPGPLDLHGGFHLVVAGSPSEGLPRATSQTFRPAAWLVAVPGDPLYAGLLESERISEGNLSTVRFLMQLAIVDPLPVPLRDPKRAIGGICQSPWDSIQPVAAQALGLMTAAGYLSSATQTP